MSDDRVLAADRLGPVALVIVADGSITSDLHELVQVAEDVDDLADVRARQLVDYPDAGCTCFLIALPYEDAHGSSFRRMRSGRLAMARSDRSRNQGRRRMCAGRSDP